MNAKLIRATLAVAMVSFVLALILLVMLAVNQSNRGVGEFKILKEESLFLYPKNVNTFSEPIIKKTLSGWHEADGNRYYLQDGAPLTGSQIIDGIAIEFDSQGGWLSSRLDVPYLSQLPDMPAGCEVVSVTMMLNYNGVQVSKEQVADQLPYDFDPSIGFTGSLFDDYYGGIIWPSGLLEIAQGYLGSAIDLTESTWDEVSTYIDAGKPVCVWISENYLNHTVLLVGYSKTQVWLNDPLLEKDVEQDLEYFLNIWSQNGYRALSY